MKYRVYYRIEGQAEYKYVNTLSSELVDKMVEECFIEDDIIFSIVAHDEVQDMDIAIFYGNRSNYELKKKQQKIKYLSKHIMGEGIMCKNQNY